MSAYHIVLLVAFVLAWIWSAINPSYPHDWLLENILVFASVPFLIWLWRYFKLSKLSYTCITLFMILHVIWSHYTYAEVPFWLAFRDFANQWGSLISNLFGWTRNSYDRLVHFSFWLLWAYPAREMFLRMVKVKGLWWYILPMALMWCFGWVYEIIEWIAAVNVNEAAGSAFLWTQWDIWDAQKDIILAWIGSAITMLIVLLINARYQKNFWKDISTSFHVSKTDHPLWEEKISEYLK